LVRARAKCLSRFRQKATTGVPDGWSTGSGSHAFFVAHTLELWAAEADQVDWWEEAEKRRPGRR